MSSLTLVAHALTPALRGLVLGGAPDPDPASVAAAGELKLAADATYAGPEPAAIATAEALGLSPIVDPALRDRDYGDWTNRPLEDLLTADPAQVTAWLERPHTAPPGGETENDVLARVADWLGDIASSDRDRIVAVVHPSVFRAIVLYVLDAPAESLRHVDVRPLATVNLSHHTGSWSLAFH
ncbi:histidine phosphatase family protein [Kribbella sandramycini]|uniref:Broad specificity phosphatase PhoE n=1 Tax=Kribbella sandramycini TaxID=60450 RepID=A0A7Y4KZQ0_9ACTN|nr:histidine phosphatase family protein [Kribbella sandramycini]MBB6565378.1 broad specificity phosphatase PhoE [Kribbella sandramycini]NOL41647.1 histidine phosphatase family protein [Kribbella sandramycini]